MQLREETHWSLITLLFLAVFLLMFITNCAIKPAVRPEWCTGQSYIYDLSNKLHVDPESVSQAMIITNYALISKCPLYTEESARGAIKNVRVLLSTGSPTYFQAMNMIVSNVEYVNKYAGAEIMLLGMFVPMLNYKVPMTECDLACLNWHLDQQERMLDAFFGNKSS